VGLVPLDESAGTVSKIAWTDLSPLQQQLAPQICTLLGLPDAIGNEALSGRAAEAFETLRSICPCDELEGMLTVQMVVNRDAALTCFRLAACPDETATSRARHLQSGQQLMTLLLRQLEALHRHRDTGKHPAPYDSAAAIAAINAEFEEFLQEALDSAPT